MRGLLIAAVLCAGCHGTALVGVSGTGSNCYLEPGPEIALAVAVSDFELGVSATYRTMHSPLGNELKHTQLRGEIMLPAALGGRVWVGTFVGGTWATWHYYGATPESTTGVYYGAVLGVGDGELGVRREHLAAGTVVQWYLRTGVRW